MLISEIFLRKIAYGTINEGQKVKGTEYECRGDSEY
jgi:hypothetical protein